MRVVLLTICLCCTGSASFSAGQVPGHVMVTDQPAVNYKELVRLYRSGEYSAAVERVRAITSERSRHASFLVIQPDADTHTVRTYSIAALSIARPLLDIYSLNLKGARTPLDPALHVLYSVTREGSYPPFHT